MGNTGGIGVGVWGSALGVGHPTVATLEQTPMTSQMRSYMQ